MKLVKGDILEFDGKGPYAAVKGARAIYMGHAQGYSGEEYITVQWIRDGFSGNQEDGNYYESQFTKVEEVSTQKEDRIFEENKKVMKIDFKEGVKRVIDLLVDFNEGFETDVLVEIKYLAIKEEDDVLEKIEDLIESIRYNKRYVKEAITRLENADSLQDILKAVEHTTLEENEASVLMAFLGVDSVTIV